jgi:hypothetical protein
VRLTCELGECTEDVLENDKENQQKRDHEGEEQAANSLCHDQGKVQCAVCMVKAGCGGVKHRQDELLRCDDHQEDASEYSKRLVEDFHPADVRRTGILDLIAKGWTEDKVDVVVDGEVLGI